MTIASLTTPRRAVALDRIAILLNANARDVTPAARALCEEVLPEAELFLSRTREEGERAAAEIVKRGHELVLSGGGDGSAVGLINMVRALGAEVPPVALLKLGTGNGWALASGAGPLRASLEEVRRRALEGDLRFDRYDLVESEGTLAPFAGLGWDARVLNDFVDGHRGHAGLQLRLRKSLAGYAYAILAQSWPKETRAYAAHGRARMTVRLLEGPAYRVSEGDKPVRLAVRPGEVLHEGTVTVTGGATIENFGFGFRAHPFARKMRGHMSFRVFDMSIPAVLTRLPSLWAGTLRHDGIRDFLVRGVRLELSRPLPFQIGGDAMGERTRVDLFAGKGEVDVLRFGA